MDQLIQARSEEDENRRIMLGLEDVRAGRISSHSEVKAWAKSLVEAAERTPERPCIHSAGTLRHE
jgi:predicted transcriptional regulator